MLLVRPGDIPVATAQELARLAPSTIYLLGGPGAISTQVEEQLGRSAPVRRLAGASRYGTAAAVSAAFAAPGVEDVFVATGRDFPDALVGSAAAGALGVPVLLVEPGSTPPETVAELVRLRPRQVTVLGGTGAVSAAVESQLGTLAPSVRRLSGATRYATSAVVAARTFPSARRALLATGSGFADAVTGAPVAAAAPGPVLLSQPACVPTETAAELGRLGVDRVSLLGGVGSLAASVAELSPCAVYVPPSPYVSRVPLPVGCHPVGPESAGVKVFLVQRALGLVGHRERFDAATVSAVRSFQSRSGLPVTGRVDRTTWDALRTGYDFCVDRYVAQPTVAPGAPASAHVAAMLAHARSRVGIPYMWGGAGPMATTALGWPSRRCTPLGASSPV